MALCRALPGVEPTPAPVAAEPPAESKEIVEAQVAVNICPYCGKGRMVTVESFPALPVNRREQRKGLILERAERRGARGARTNYRRGNGPA